MPETGSQAWERRMIHLSAHPVAWARYVWRRELLHHEVRFRENPRFLDWGPMYRVARPGIVRLTGRSPSELDQFFHEIQPLHDRLLQQVGSFPAAGAMMQAPLLYLMVRATAPKEVVETGLSSGYSARLILEALERNGNGRLTSVGLAQFGVHPGAREAKADLAGKEVGWLVPDRLRPRWNPRLGSSEAVLAGALADLGSIDLFVHDSLHQYPTMAREFRQGWAVLRPGGFLGSHDIQNNAAWPDFLAEYHLAVDEVLDHDLGVVRHPPTS